MHRYRAENASEIGVSVFLLMLFTICAPYVYFSFLTLTMYTCWILIILFSILC